jgi:cyclopropane fatty-acyl-phospholipid synthase-like methyltransferase
LHSAAVLDNRLLQHLRGGWAQPKETTVDKSVADHWGKGDVFGRVMEAMKAASISPDTVTVEQMAPVDHLHARGFHATIELADALPINEGDHLVDIGCGLGGPARYLAERFNCRVSGIDITAPFIDAANKITALLKMEQFVDFRLGDGQELPYADQIFDGGYTQHVTMNIADREKFFSEAFRVLKPGGYFALTEHGLGPNESPYYPCPWSDDGSGAFLVLPKETVSFLENTGFSEIDVLSTGNEYLAGYKKAMQLAARGELPAFGAHILLGENALAKTKNAARNIEEGRTSPIQVICRKPN